MCVRLLKLKIYYSHTAASGGGLSSYHLPQQPQCEVRNDSIDSTRAFIYGEKQGRGGHRPVVPCQGLSGLK